MTSLTSNNAAASVGGQKPASAVDPALLASIMEEVGKKFVTKEEHARLEERLDNITDAFEPPTQHALFETAIYEFVDQKIPLI